MDFVPSRVQHLRRATLGLATAHADGIETMNHDVIAKAICGHYTRLSDNSGYLESIYSARGDGSLLGAYIVGTGAGSFLVTDDGDTLFNAAATGAALTSHRVKSYRKAVEASGAVLTSEGEIRVETRADRLTTALSSYFRAALAISDLAYKHRPSDTERFIRTVGEDLSRYGDRVVRRPTIVGLSGHQLAFHFGIDVVKPKPIMIHAIAASESGLKWADVYEAGGKFKDAKAARSTLRLVAILEDARDVDKASSFLADLADVYVYRGEPLPIAA